jgi:hypothetical protein
MPLTFYYRSGKAMYIKQWVIFMHSEAGEFIEERTEDLRASLLQASRKGYTILEILDTSYDPLLAPF